MYRSSEGIPISDHAAVRGCHYSYPSAPRPDRAAVRAPARVCARPLGSLSIPAPARRGPLSSRSRPRGWPGSSFLLRMILPNSALLHPFVTLGALSDKHWGQVTRVPVCRRCVRRRKRVSRVARAHAHASACACPSAWSCARECGCLRARAWVR